MRAKPKSDKRRFAADRRDIIFAKKVTKPAPTKAKKS